MDVERFLEEHGLTENPFGAEEARHDPVFEKIAAGEGMSHPELVKVLGSPDRPHTSVVFGEKGSGKTALRLLMAQRITRFSNEHPDRRTLLVAYDDFNPVLDTMAHNKARHGSRRSRDPDRLLASFRLEDHQDAILSLAVTKVVSGVLGVDAHAPEAMVTSGDMNEKLRGLPKPARVDLAVLAALYDSPRGGSGSVERWGQLLKKLRLGFSMPYWLLQGTVIVLTSLALALFLAVAPATSDWFKLPIPSGWLAPSAVGVAVLALVSCLALISTRMKVWRLARRIQKECLATDRTRPQLRRMLADIPAKEREGQPWPRPGGDSTQARYEMTTKLIKFIGAFGYNSMVVLIDRVDEPTLVAGRPERMRRLIWPMFDSKFLQQDRIGLKLLLPLELRYLMHKEDAAFFQEARLDKQSLVDRLAWSGATLYDLCSARLRACNRDKDSPITLADLFEEDVTRAALIEALGQMQQPRDAFKMIYAVILAHCNNVPADDGAYRIPKLTLESVRREQAMRINELQRGLSPA